MPEIYEPGEDSYLLSDALKKELPKLLNKNQNLRFLEVGSGSGINLQTALSLGIKKENIIGCDINEEAVKHCKNLGFNCVKSDLFDNIKGKFDVIAFNPPYLPLDNREPKNSRLNTNAGIKGNEVIIRFLKDAKRYINDKGTIFLLTSSLTPKINFLDLDYKFKILNEKSLFFEKIYCWELTMFTEYLKKNVTSLEQG